MAYKDLDRRRERTRERNLEYKLKAHKMLGGKCVKCGYNESHCALHIDHIKPQLFSHHRGYNYYNSGRGLHKQIALGKVPLDNFQLLCANCHSIKTFEVDRLYFKSRYNMRQSSNK